jgi:hypothetical protein
MEKLWLKSDDAGFRDQLFFKSFDVRLNLKTYLIPLVAVFHH